MKDPHATQSPQTLAAVDLGSNSFHMVVARLVNGQLQVIDRLRERVKLADGLDEDNVLSPDAIGRAEHALEMFAQRLSSLPSENIKVMGTSTLRTARNGEEVLRRFAEALQHPVEIISGREEARLVYLGVAHALADDHGRRLVVDIGGGSTECIIGERFEATVVESLHMGCVTYTKRFFPDGRLTLEAFKQAQTAARVELRPLVRRFQSLGWQSAVGSSGTIRAIDQLLAANGWATGGITLDGMRMLRSQLIEAKTIDAINMPGLQSERASVLAGGVAILYSVFKALGVTQMTASTGALREGVLFELIGRLGHEDVRPRTIESLMRRYDVDEVQAGRVEETAWSMMDQVAGAWGFDEQDRQWVGWAARLHEIGLALTYGGYHKHGAYLIEHSDLPGFSRPEQFFLSTLVGAHRRKMRPAQIEALEKLHGAKGLKLAVLLRLAVALHRGRDGLVPDFEMVAIGNEIEVKLASVQSQSRPMTEEILAEEGQRLAKIGITLDIKGAA